MGRIATTLDQCRKENRAALVIYVCAGDPDLGTTAELLRAIDKAGADVIELGVPFSDPTADGPVIQQASERALENGANLPSILDMLKTVRPELEASVLLFGYFNPIFNYGQRKLVKDAKASGADGFLCVDLPPEVGGEFHQLVTEHGLDYVPLIAPTTDDKRAIEISKLATSFIYYVSVTGVTGSSQVDLESIAPNVKNMRQITQKPIAIGFGIKTPDDVKKASQFADGVIVGSAVVQTIEQAQTKEEAIEKTKAFVQSLRQAIDSH